MEGELENTTVTVELNVRNEEDVDKDTNKLIICKESDFII